MIGGTEPRRSPTRVAMDVVANVYNTDAPRDVPVVRESLIRRSEEFATEGGRELGLDFDFFLSQIMEEYAAGRAPVNPMEAPRRVEGAGREGGRIVAPWKETGSLIDE